MAKRHNRTGRTAGVGEHWTKTLRHTMECDAWRALPSSAQALYPWLKLEWRGPGANNNGRIRLSTRQAAERMGVALNTAASAFRDLQAKGFLVQTESARLGIEGAAKSPAYEITELAMPGANHPDGRKLFLEWRAGDDFPVARALANNPAGRNGRKKTCLKNDDGPVSITKTERAIPVSITKTGRHKNDDETAVLERSPVSRIKTSLSYHGDSATEGGRNSTAPSPPAPSAEIVQLPNPLSRSKPADVQRRVVDAIGGWEVAQELGERFEALLDEAAIRHLTHAQIFSLAFPERQDGRAARHG